MDNESFWLLDVDEDVYDKRNTNQKTLSAMSSPASRSTCFDSSFEHNQEYDNSSRSMSWSADNKMGSTETLSPFMDDTPIGFGNTVNASSSALVGFGNNVVSASSYNTFNSNIYNRVISTNSNSVSNTNMGNPNTISSSSNVVNANTSNYRAGNIDIMDWDNYQKYINELNNDIEEFSKIIQTLGLFKYYIKNKKNTINIMELNKRFNSICITCSDKIRQIEQKLNKINYCNHYIMVNDTNLTYLRKRFNLQDSAIKKLKILIDTFNTVIREYTHLSKKLLILGDVTNTGVGNINTMNSASNTNVDRTTGSDADNTFTTHNSGKGSANGSGSPTSGVVGSINTVVTATSINASISPVCSSEITDMDKKSLLNEINSRTRDIQILEQNARDLNELFAELNSIIKKRGDNISSLENQILLSSEQIDKGAEDIMILLKNDRRLQALYIISGCIVLGTCFLIIPSNLKNLIFKRF